MKQTTLASFFKKPSTPKAPEEPQAKKGPGAEVVGRRLEVWWPADEAWYAPAPEDVAEEVPEGEKVDKVPPLSPA